MATVYKIEMTICSPYVNYDEESMRELMYSLLHSKRGDKIVLEFDKGDIDIRRY
jgi:hypothetical protein